MVDLYRENAATIALLFGGSRWEKNCLRISPVRSGIWSKMYAMAASVCLIFSVLLFGGTIKFVSCLTLCSRLSHWLYHAVGVSS